MPDVDATDIFVKLLTRMSPTEAVHWLSRPHPLLDNRAPDALIAEGKKNEVLALLNGTGANA